MSPTPPFTYYGGVVESELPASHSCVVIEIFNPLQDAGGERVNDGSPNPHPISMIHILCIHLFTGVESVHAPGCPHFIGIVAKEVEGGKAKVTVTVLQIRSSWVVIEADTADALRPSFLLLDC